MQILIVDDQASQRVLLRQVIGAVDATMSIADFGDPVEALRWSRDVVPDLVVLDYRMPNMDGLEFARRFRRPASHRDVKLMLVTGIQDKPLAQTALDAGICDVLHKPFSPFELQMRCKNLLQQRRTQRTLETRIQQLEEHLQQVASAAERRECGLFEQLVRAACEREGQHVDLPRRVGRIAGMLARAAGLPAPEAAEIEESAWLHDIGNVALPEDILTKPGLLTSSGRGMMRKHTVLGYQLLKDSPLGRTAAVIALHHHECWDGTGYPDGLAGTAIPMAARVVAIASTLSALTAYRPYQPAWSVDRALDYVRNMGGVLFDPALVAAIGAHEGAFAELLAEGAEDWGRRATPVQWTGAALSSPAVR